ncbi:MAG: hydroxymethylbilane synthase [Planctomycetaceae bacterium]
MNENEQTRPLLRIATRSSALAMWQANHVRNLMADACPSTTFTLVQVSTIGDRDRQSRLADFGGQGVFTKEVQAALLDGRADIAVHSLKDLPTVPVSGLMLAGTPSRASQLDVLVLPEGRQIQSLDELPEGASVATGSLRRQAQLLHVRPDLRFVPVRGNVETRLQKLDDGEFDALVLAAAGLDRLEHSQRISLALQPPNMLPAVGQGALGLECRADHTEAEAVVTAITDFINWSEVRAERSCLRKLQAGCHAPVGVYSSWGESLAKLTLDAVVLSSDGRQRLHVAVHGPADDPETLGSTAAEQLLALGAGPLLEAQ